MKWFDELKEKLINATIALATRLNSRTPYLASALSCSIKLKFENSKLDPLLSELMQRQQK